MAQKVYLKLMIDGTDIIGESTVASLDREDSIECSAFYYGVQTPRDISGRLISKRQHEPVRIQKRIDRSTPLLLKALCRNELVNEAEFRFFRENLAGAGQEEHFYTVKLENGFITSINQVSEDNIVGGVPSRPMMEEVAFFFRTITWTYEDDGATYMDGSSKPLSD